MSIMKIEPRTWAYNPMRYFNRVGKETAENFDGVRNVAKTIPATLKYYRLLPKTYSEARENFLKEYRVPGRNSITYMNNDAQYKNFQACCLKIFTFLFLLFVPTGKILDNLVPLYVLDAPLAMWFSETQSSFSYLPIACTFWLSIICYMIFCYKGFTCRNHITMNPITFTILLFRYPVLLFPVQPYNFRMNDSYGDEWKKYVFRKEETKGDK